MLSSYKELIVWQKSYQLTKQVYRLTDKLPSTETYGLSSQLQRCAVSIPSNIAEGQQRNNLGEYRQFIGVARGSAAELETQLLLAGDIYNISVQAELELLYEIQKMLSVLLKKLSPRT